MQAAHEQAVAGAATAGVKERNLAAAGCALALEREELAQHRAQLHGLNRLVQQV